MVTENQRYRVIGDIVVNNFIGIIIVFHVVSEMKLFTEKKTVVKIS